MNLCQYFLSFGLQWGIPASLWKKVVFSPFVLNPQYNPGAFFSAHKKRNMQISFFTDSQKNPLKNKMLVLLPLQMWEYRWACFFLGLFCHNIFLSGRKWKLNSKQFLFFPKSPFFVWHPLNVKKKENARFNVTIKQKNAVWPISTPSLKQKTRTSENTYPQSRLRN